MWLFARRAEVGQYKSGFQFSPHKERCHTEIMRMQQTDVTISSFVPSAFRTNKAFLVVRADVEQPRVCRQAANLSVPVLQASPFVPFPKDDEKRLQAQCGPVTFLKVICLEKRSLGRFCRLVLNCTHFIYFQRFTILFTPIRSISMLRSKNKHAGMKKVEWTVLQMTQNIISCIYFLSVSSIHDVIFLSFHIDAHNGGSRLIKIVSLSPDGRPSSAVLRVQDRLLELVHHQEDHMRRRTALLQRRGESRWEAPHSKNLTVQHSAQRRDVKMPPHPQPTPKKKKNGSRICHVKFFPWGSFQNWRTFDVTPIKFK